MAIPGFELRFKALIDGAWATASCIVAIEVKSAYHRLTSCIGTKFRKIDLDQIEADPTDKDTENNTRISVFGAPGILDVWVAP